MAIRDRFRELVGSMFSTDETPQQVPPESSTKRQKPTSSTAKIASQLAAQEPVPSLANEKRQQGFSSQIEEMARKIQSSLDDAKTARTHSKVADYVIEQVDACRDLTLREFAHKLVDIGRDKAHPKILNSADVRAQEHLADLSKRLSTLQTRGESIPELVLGEALMNYKLAKARLEQKPDYVSAALDRVLLATSLNTVSELLSQQPSLDQFVAPEVREALEARAQAPTPSGPSR